jgi:glycosyltransferase involved in cell wall biosynthesis
VLGRLRIDVVLAEYGTTATEVRHACNLAGIPLVACFYGFDVWRDSLVQRYLPDYEHLFAEAAAIVAVSDSIRQRLLAWGAPVAKLHHIVCGADATRFSGATPERAEPLFIAVGRFVEKKAPLITVRAFRDTAAADPRATLCMVGDGPLLGAARRLAAEYGLEGKIRFLGVRPPAEVAEMFKGARAFVQHSVTAADGDREGTPVAILEAQMAGLPVIATRHSGIPEIVLDGETGLLVGEGDTRAMADAMTRLSRDAELAGRMGRRAREAALANHSLETSLQALARELESAAAGRRQ